MSNLSTHAAQTARRYLLSPSPAAGAIVVASAVLLSLLALLPLGFVIGVAFETGWQTVKALVFRPRVAELLLNTLLLVVLTLPICAVLGVARPLTERTTLPGRRLWAVLATAPLAVPAFVQSYAGSAGAVDARHGRRGLHLGARLFPVHLPAGRRRAAPAGSRYRRCRHLARFPAAGGLFPRGAAAAEAGGLGRLLLIALHLLAEYGLYAMIRFDTFTTAIFDQFQSTFNGPAANMLAGVLVLCCLGLLLLEALSRGRARYARVGSGSARSQTPRRLSLPLAALALLLPISLTALALGVPFITGPLAVAGGFEVWRNAELWPALWQTLSLSAVGALLITLCAIPMAWLSVRYPARLYRVLEGCNYVTSSLPGIVVALATVTITIHSFRPIYQTEITLLLAYLLMFMPRALINLRAGIAQAPVELENVARSLGKSPAQALWSTTLRLAAPGAAAGAALVFPAIANELTATLLLAPNGTRTLATGFWALTSEIDYVAAAPYALIMVALSLPLTASLFSI